MKKIVIISLATALMGTNLLAFDFLDIFKSVNQDSVHSKTYPSRTTSSTVMPTKLEKNAVAVINKFIKITQENSYSASSRMVVPLIHKSLLTRDQRELDSDTLQYSFKKAYNNSVNYRYPVVITRIDKLKTTEIGYGSTYEAGVEYKLWIAKKDSKGYAAPLVLFFRDGRGEPKLSYLGSL